MRVLLVERDKRLTRRELAVKAHLSLAMVAKITIALQSAGQLLKQRGIRVLSVEKLLKGWAHTVSVHEYPKMEFLAAERPQYLIRKISQLLGKETLRGKETYAFTLFSATEIVAPYVAPDKVHLYVLKGEEKKISELFQNNGILPAEQGNIICYLVDQNHFYGTQQVQRVKVIALPQLYVDLVSYGGRGEEAAEQVLGVMKRV